MNEEKLPTEPETIEELMKKIENLEKEKNEYFESLKRAKSDVLRMQREFEEKFQTMQDLAHSELIYHLLSVLDSFDLAFQKNEKIDQGFYLIYSQLKDILEKYGLEEIDVENKKFDPNFHEALQTVKCEKENCSGEDEGLIVEILSKGYLYKGRLLRPARVKIIIH
jgi:molecular chaperone GrpE